MRSMRWARISFSFLSLFFAFTAALPGYTAAAVTIEIGDESRKKEIEATLQEFFRDPVGVMDQRVKKWNSEGQVVSAIESRFSPAEIGSGNYVTARDATRRRMCMEVDGKTRCLGDKAVDGPLSGIWGEDRFENLIDVSVATRTLEGLESRGLMNARLDKRPWSDDYWPFYKGILGARYADRYFPDTENWGILRNYVLNQSVTSVLRSGSQRDIDRLSPAEKYDLLLGDWNLTLTQGMWQLGANFYYSRGFVETWMGICEGWAAASIMLPRPTEVVSAIAADGRTRLNFYPSDIKGLASLLWAHGKKSIRFIGGRCEESRPARDYNGRVVSQRCFDNNPATFHLALSHQVGLAGRSLVMDATYDYEVWNHPVYSYRYTYFNPQTGAAVDKLRDAEVSMGRFSRDKFSAYRSSNASSVVGIALDVVYMLETDPWHRRTDSEDYDSYRKTRYLYDLELDSSGKIIGGEWYTNRHPDFLWVPLPWSHARSNFDSEAYGRWDMSEPLPNSWRNAGYKASTYNQPLGPVVEALIRR